MPSGLFGCAAVGWGSKFCSRKTVIGAPVMPAKGCARPVLPPTHPGRTVSPNARTAKEAKDENLMRRLAFPRARARGACL